MYATHTLDKLNTQAVLRAATRTAYTEWATAGEKARLARAQNHPTALSLEAIAAEKRAEYDRLDAAQRAPKGDAPEDIIQRAKELNKAH